MIVPVPPVDLDKLFGRQAALSLHRFVDFLAGPGLERGLLGPRELPRLWDRHVLNSAAIAPLLPNGARIADVGSGAGLPGIVLAIIRPDLEIVLVDSLQRRVDFLTEVCAGLGLDAVAVVRSRAEDYGPTLTAAEAFDVVTARAVAPLDRLVEWTLPLLRPGGRLIAVKGARAGDELRAYQHRIRALGGVDVSIETVGSPPVHATVVLVTRGRPERSARRGP